MYLVTIHDTIVVGKYENLSSFALSTFSIDISKRGVVIIENKESPISYNMQQYSTYEVVDDFVKNNFFKAFIKSRYYSVYTVEQII